MVKFLVAVVMFFGLYAPSAAWKPPCLGIFESKAVCAAERRVEANTAKCAAQSRKQCRPIADRDRKAVDEYDDCWDRAQCACMRAHGYEDCSPSRRD